MKPTQRTLESAVFHSIYREEDGGIDAVTQPVAPPPGGTTAYNVQISFTPPMSEIPSTEGLSVRADTPEGAKTIALQIASDKGYTDVSVVSVDVIPGSGDSNTPPPTMAINPQPDTLAGLVLPTAVHRDLDTSQVILPPASSPAPKPPDTAAPFAGAGS